MVNYPNQRRNHHAGLIAGIAAVVLAVCCGGSLIAIVFVGKGTSDALKTSGAAPSATAGMNTPVRDGRFEFVVKDVSCGKHSVGSGILTSNAQGEYCIITVSVKNIATKAQSFFVSNQKAMAGDIEYEPDSAATAYAGTDQSTWINDINPGNQIQGPLVYDVPIGTVLDKVVLHDSLFSGGVAVKLT
jgi:hypothetical protein